MKNPKSGRQSYQRGTIQVRIDEGMHRILKVEAIRAGKTIKEYLEEILTEYWDKEGVCF